MSSTTLRHDPTRGRWIPWIFVGGMLLVVVVNAALIVAAVSTFTGVTVGKAYDRGRAYNHVLQEAARQEALGWRARVTLDAAVLSVTISDRDDLPVPGRLTGVLRRPLEGTELPLDFAAVGAGRFVSSASLPAAGQWEAELTLHAADGNRFNIRQRVMAR